MTVSCERSGHWWAHDKCTLLLLLLQSEAWSEYLTQELNVLWRYATTDADLVEQVNVGNAKWRVRPEERVWERTGIKSTQITSTCTSVFFHGALRPPFTVKQPHSFDACFQRHTSVRKVKNTNSLLSDANVCVCVCVCMCASFDSYAWTLLMSTLYVGFLSNCW